MSMSWCFPLVISHTEVMTCPKPQCISVLTTTVLDAAESRVSYLMSYICTLAHIHLPRNLGCLGMRPVAKHWFAHAKSEQAILCKIRWSKLSCISVVGILEVHLLQYWWYHCMNGMKCFIAAIGMQKIHEGFNAHQISPQCQVIYTNVLPCASRVACMITEPSHIKRVHNCDNADWKQQMRPPNTYTLGIFTLWYQ